MTMNETESEVKSEHGYGMEKAFIGAMGSSSGRSYERV